MFGLAGAERIGSGCDAVGGQNVTALLTLADNYGVACFDGVSTVEGPWLGWRTEYEAITKGVGGAVALALGRLAAKDDQLGSPGGRIDVGVLTGDLTRQGGPQGTKVPEGRPDVTTAVSMRERF